VNIGGRKLRPPILDFTFTANVMATKKEQFFVEEQKILNRIYLIRGQKIMLDRDLAELYGVETKRLKEAVKRNRERFPKDFMFEMTDPEFKKWREDASLNAGAKQGLRYAPFCFTEPGVTMLSCTLNSAIAIQVNINILRVFTKLREYALTHKDILMKLAQLEREVNKINRSTERNGQDIEKIFTVLKELIARDAKPTPRKRIGFRRSDDQD
jgi:hypothetical protein